MVGLDSLADILFSEDINVDTNKSRGAAFAYRVALWHPELVSHLFTVCVPYPPPKEGYIPLETVVRTAAPNFTYQVQFASGELEKVIKSKDEIKQFLLALYGGRTPEGQFGFDVQKGALLDKLPRLNRSRLLNEAVCSIIVKMQLYRTDVTRNWTIMLQSSQGTEYMDLVCLSPFIDEKNMLS